MNENFIVLLGWMLVLMPLGLVVYSVVSYMCLKYELYFLHFHIKDHPLLIQKIEKVLKNICETENLPVFHVPYERLNNNPPTSNVIGRYVYAKNIKEALKAIEEVKRDIQVIEMKYGKPYNQLCIECGLTPVHEERLHMPRIMLVEEKEKYDNLENYYCTYFHELGHHFFIKERGATIEHTENDADNWAAKLIKEHLPDYFLLFYDFSYRYRDNGLTLTKKEKIIALINFLKYTREKRQFDKSLKQNTVEIRNR